MRIMEMEWAERALDSMLHSKSSSSLFSFSLAPEPQQTIVTFLPFLVSNSARSHDKVKIIGRTVVLTHYNLRKEYRKEKR